MELKKAIVNLLDTVNDESHLMYFYALLRKTTSDIELAEVLDEIFDLRKPPQAVS